MTLEIRFDLITAKTNAIKTFVRTNRYFKTGAVAIVFAINWNLNKTNNIANDVRTIKLILWKVIVYIRMR